MLLCKKYQGLDNLMVGTNWTPSEVLRVDNKTTWDGTIYSSSNRDPITLSEKLKAKYKLL